MSNKKKTKRLIEKKYIILYNNPQFLLFSFVFLKTFLSFQTLIPATQQSKTKQKKAEPNHLFCFQHLSLIGLGLDKRFACTLHLHYLISLALCICITLFHFTIYTHSMVWILMVTVNG